jgi:hypothetical protein
MKGDINRAETKKMFILRQRISIGHWDDVYQERRLNLVVLFKQMPQEFILRKRCKKAEMDCLLRERRERQSIALSAEL